MKLSVRKRLALIAAAQQEFIEHGYAGANMDRVCERAATSKRTLYRHFASKEVLFVASIQAVLAEQQAKLQIRYEPSVAIESQLKAYLLAKLETIHEDFGLPLARMVISEFIRSPALVGRYLEKFDHHDEQLDAWFAHAIADGKVKALAPTVMSSMLLCLLKGHLMWPQLITNQALPDSLGQERIIDDILDVFLNGYRA
uniref:TetR/AcrR family transcriptional regulator n=1 Tax=Thaumasiovibrio occultus TaxID=1891184 RepID=UPI000B36447B|nr:TetR/AcrR family transcriptional regulator [Thaumasiovibrio occultus]